MALRSFHAVAQLLPSAFEPLRETYHVGTEGAVGTGVGVAVGAGVGVGVGPGVGVGVGVGVGIGVGVGLGPAPTTTLCSTVAWRPSPSVMVKRAYFVPTSWKVKLIVTPPPRIEPSASSDQMKAQGLAAQLQPLPLKETAWPVTGFAGLYVKLAVGPGVGVGAGVGVGVGVTVGPAVGGGVGIGVGVGE